MKAFCGFWSMPKIGLTFGNGLFQKICAHPLQRGSVFLTFFHEIIIGNPDFFSPLKHWKSRIFPLQCGGNPDFFPSDVAEIQTFPLQCGVHVHTHPIEGFGIPDFSFPVITGNQDFIHPQRQKSGLLPLRSNLCACAPDRGVQNSALFLSSDHWNSALFSPKVLELQTYYKQANGKYSPILLIQTWWDQTTAKFEKTVDEENV